MSRCQFPRGGSFISRARALAEGPVLKSQRPPGGAFALMFLQTSAGGTADRARLLRIVLAQPFQLRVPIQFANGHRVLAPVLRDLDEQPEINPRA
jgi:hypothetical protein